MAPARNPQNQSDILFGSSIGSQQVATQVAWHNEKAIFLCGDQLDHDDIPETERISMLKVGLDKSKETSNIRDRIEDQLHAIAARKSWANGLQSFLLNEISQEEAPENERFSMFRLGLDHSEKSRPDILEIIAIYLKELYGFAEKEIRSTLGKRIGFLGGSKSIFESAKVRTLLAIPAAWCDRQDLCQDLLAAAGWAGMVNVELISEAEASAASVIEQYQHQANSQVAREWLSKIRRPYLIIDGGGGTVDIVAYIVERDGNTDRRKEGAEATGGCYGSGILNSIFRNYYDSVSYPDTKEMEDTARQNLLDDAVLDFEGEKKGFNGMDPINIKVPDHIKIRPSIRGPRHTISIPCDDIKDLFRQILVPTIALMLETIQSVNRQYEHSVGKLMTIMFVGGMSCSPYIFEALQAEFETGPSFVELGYAVDVCKPLQGSTQTLVSDGAILSAIDKDAVNEKILRHSLDFAWDEPWDANIHAESRKDRDFDGTLIARNCTKSIFNRGESIRGLCSNSFIGWKLVRLTGDWEIMEILYGSKETGVDHEDAHDRDKFEEDGELHFIAKEDEIDRSQFRRAEDERYVISDYEVRITIKFPIYTYEVIIPSNGKFPGKSAYGKNAFRKSASGKCAGILNVTTHRPYLAEPPTSGFVSEKSSSPEGDDDPEDGEYQEK